MTIELLAYPKDGQNHDFCIIHRYMKRVKADHSDERVVQQDFFISDKLFARPHAIFREVLKTDKEHNE